MKRTLLFLAVLFILQTGNAQSNTQAPAPSDKAVVYFVRPNTMGGLINFTYFDGDKVIGRFNASKYLRYECAPGEHTFWARSENKSIVEANVEAGKIYILEAVPVMGAMKAAVDLRPISSGSSRLKAISRLLSKKPSQSFSDAELEDLAIKMKGVQERGKDKIDRKKDKEIEVEQLTADMSVTPEELVFSKKKK